MGFKEYENRFLSHMFWSVMKLHWRPQICQKHSLVQDATHSLLAGWLAGWLNSWLLSNILYFYWLSLFSLFPPPPLFSQTGKARPFFSLGKKA